MKIYLLDLFETLRSSKLHSWIDGMINRVHYKSCSSTIILKKRGFESVHEFSSRFMRVYNSIPADIKPSVGAAKLHYAEAFDNDFALLLRERKSTSLHVMFTNALEVEANMMACGKIKQRVDIDRRKGREKTMPSTSSASSSNDIKFEMMLKTMENLMDRLTMDTRPMN